MKLEELKEKIIIETNSYRASKILAPLLLEMYEAIQRRMASDEACGHHFDENLGDALNEMENFLNVSN
jgi:hypothetical protein